MDATGNNTIKQINPISEKTISLSFVVPVFYSHVELCMHMLNESGSETVQENKGGKQGEGRKTEGKETVFI